MKELSMTGSKPWDAQRTSVALRVAAVVAVLAAMALSAPLIWAAVSAGAGLAVLLGMAIAGTVVFHLLPLGFQMMENRILKLRKTEARNNPMEQLQNEVMRRGERLQAFRKALADIGGQIESMTQMLDERRHRDPGHVLERQDRALVRMQQFYTANLKRLNEAQGALESFQHQVKQKVFEWEFAQAGQVVMSALKPNEVDQLMQELLTDEAIRSVQTRFNTVFAELDVQLCSIDAPTRDMLAGSGFDQSESALLREPRNTRRTP